MEKSNEIKRLISEGKFDTALSTASDLVSTIEPFDEEMRNEKMELESDLTGFKSRNAEIKKKNRNEVSDKQAMNTERNKLNHDITHWADDELKPVLVKHENIKHKKSNNTKRNPIHEIIETKLKKPTIESPNFWRIASFVLGLGLICSLLTHLLPKPTAKQFSLSSTGGIKSPWISSGIRVKAGDKIEIYPSGKVNLAMHHAMETAIRDTIFPSPNWSFPEGFLIPDSILTDVQRFKENTRDNRRLKKSPFGRLIWYISEEEPIQPIANQDEIQEYELGKNEYLCSKSGILWFTINEVWIYQEYFDKFHARDFYLDEKVWNWLKKNKRYGIWYEDNLGDFDITLIVK